MKTPKTMLMACAAFFGAVQAWGETWSQMTLTHVESSGPDARKLFDNDASTKWRGYFIGDGANWVEFTASAGVPSRLDLVTADDTYQGSGWRNWKGWTLYGLEGSEWVLIQSWSNESPSLTYGEATQYCFDNNKAYARYKLVLNSTFTNAEQQMADLKFYCDTSRGPATVACSDWAQVRANIEAGNNVELAKDVTLGDGATGWVQSNFKTATFDLKGHTFFIPVAAKRAFTSPVGDDGAAYTLTLKDSVGGGKICRPGGDTGSFGCSGSFILLGNNDTFVMESGVIDGLGCGDGKEGSGVIALATNSPSTFVMNGGIITNCVASNVGGGAVNVFNKDSAFTMNGGTIACCSAVSGSGGAVYNLGKFTMNGGTITGCTASGSGDSGYGGGIYTTGECVLRGGTISGCGANQGGALCMFGGSGAIYDGMTIESTVPSGLGSCFVQANTDVKLYVNGGTFTGTAAPAFTTRSIGQICVYGGCFNTTNPFDSEKTNMLTVQGGVYVTNPDGNAKKTYATGYASTQIGAKWVVGQGVTQSDSRLTGGTFAFCPTNAAYVAAGVAVSDRAFVTENETDPKTWTLVATEPIPSSVNAPANATVAVYTNGVLSADGTVWLNQAATVVYTADAGCLFADGSAAVTNTLDTTVNPAVDRNPAPMAEKTSIATSCLVPEYLGGVAANGIARWYATNVQAEVVRESASRVTWNAGWYVVTNAVTVSGGADVRGEVHLIIADGASLTINGVASKYAGVAVTNGNSFAVYGQAEGTGVFNVRGGSGGAGIGGNFGSDGVNITINGCNVTANGSSYEMNDAYWCPSCIGGGLGGSGSNITINGGKVTAIGDMTGATGIGGSVYFSTVFPAGHGECITINGGTVIAKGLNGSSGIGGGNKFGNGKNITINGGDVTSTAESDGAGIGGGWKGCAENIFIFGGKVTASGGNLNGTSAIGNGANCSTDAKNIFAACGATIKADGNNPPTTVIEYGGPNDDIASLLKGKRYATCESAPTVTVTVPEVAGASAELFAFCRTGGWTPVQPNRVPSNATVRVLWTAAAGKGLTAGKAKGVYQWQVELVADKAEQLAASPTVAEAGESEVAVDIDLRAVKSYFDAKDVLPIWHAAGTEVQVKGEGEQQGTTLVKNSATTNTLHWTPTRQDTYTLTQTDFASAKIFFVVPVEVTTNGLGVAGTEVAVTVGGEPLTPQTEGEHAGKLIVASNSSVSVTWTVTEPGKCFADGSKTYVAAFTADKPVNAASEATKLPETPNEPTVKLGVVAQRYPWNGKIDVQCRLCCAKTAEATLKVTANGVEKTQDVTLANGVNALVFDAKAAFGEVMAKQAKVELKLK